MISRQLTPKQFFHFASTVWSSTKSDLSVLRKKTGYTFANCKKALDLNNNDLLLAEKWLKEQAQALGWEKASKLEGRVTLQGLIGIGCKSGSAVMVEVNCETDFVARNKKFRSLVELCTETCLNEAFKIDNSNHLTKVFVSNEQIKNFIGPEEKPLADHVALTVANLAENLNLRRAVILKAPENIHFSIYAHPFIDDSSNKILSGKYGSVVAYVSQCNTPEQQGVAKQLCQHVVGMNPARVGNVEEDVPAENKDDEVAMLFQEFLLDPEITVKQILETSGISVVDFVRFECGEMISFGENESVAMHAS